MRSKNEHLIAGYSDLILKKDLVVYLCVDHTITDTITSTDISREGKWTKQNFLIWVNNHSFYSYSVLYTDWIFHPVDAKAKNSGQDPHSSQLLSSTFYGIPSRQVHTPNTAISSVQWCSRALQRYKRPALT